VIVPESNAPETCAPSGSEIRRAKTKMQAETTNRIDLEGMTVYVLHRFTMDGLPIPSITVVNYRQTGDQSSIQSSQDFRGVYLTT
jgi:hypothetical protein